MTVADERDIPCSQRAVDVRQHAGGAGGDFLEGFARPLDGVRVIIRVLLEKYRQAGGERRMKCGVAKIIEREGRAAVLQLDDGSEVTA